MKMLWNRKSKEATCFNDNLLFGRPALCPIDFLFENWGVRCITYALAGLGYELLVRRALDFDLGLQDIVDAGG
jgi:hypothetical protein